MVALLFSRNQHIPLDFLLQGSMCCHVNGDTNYPFRNKPKEDRKLPAYTIKEVQPLTHIKSSSSVGLFWFVPDTDGKARLLPCLVHINDAVDYGDHLIAEIGHAEFWQDLNAEGAAGLENMGLPTAPAFFEYEDYPRGRVSFHRPTRRFLILADRKLHTPRYIDEIVRTFGIDPDRNDVVADEHYVSNFSTGR